MSKQLGINVRVRVGWAPPEQLILNGKPDPRLRTATITHGPFVPGLYEMSTGEEFRIGHTYWGIAYDEGAEAIASERILTPIDDDDPKVLIEPIEQEVEV